uniref:Craniofacial development protein 2 n=1 Tax=Cacopsylla melanoneura TaxID=428564 RepID=A0A8D8WWJ8_9HEMI
MKTGRIRHCPRTGQRKGFDATELHLATWNVRTLLQAGKMQEVAREMLKYKLDLIAIQEIRWQGQGKIDKKDFSIIYSGPNNKTGQLGTGFLINKTIRSSILEYKTVNDRICKIRLKGKFRNITIITVHAPTEDKPEEDKDRFYEELDDTLAQVQRYDMVLVMGDFNAQIGSKESQRDVAGPFTLHEYNNDNGDFLAEFASRNKLYISSSSFQHKKIHLGTWKIHGTNKTTQIDHVLVSKRHFSSVTDVRTCRGPNCDSDHFLLKIKIRAKLSTLHTLKRQKQTKWDTDDLKTNEVTQIKYQDTIAEKLEGRQPNNLEEKWMNTKEAILEAAKDTIPEKNNNRNASWFDEECESAIHLKNEARAKMIARNTRSNADEYRDRRKEATKILKKKKKNSMKKEIELIEQLSREDEVRKFYAAAKKIRTKEFQPKTSGCRNSTGAIIMDETWTMKIWANHFQQLLNRPEDIASGVDTPETSITANQETSEEMPTAEEVNKAIQRMKNNRAPGEDGIVAELLKYGGDTVASALTEIIQEVWRTEKMPSSWSTGIICAIHKKGDVGRCENYRGITLLDTAYKVFTTILNNRIKMITNDKIGEYQCGFREARGTTDQLFVVRQIMEKCFEHDIDLYVLFVDFKQAFDSVRRCKIAQTMIDLDISPKLINLAMMTMENSKARVKISNKLSDPFNITTGVKQGDGLSTTLFIIALHRAIKDTDQRGTIFYKSSQICAYADDVGIFARTENKLIEVFRQIRENAAELGLAINEDKTVFMKISASQDRRTMEDLVIDDVVYKAVAQFKYLGEQVNNEGRMSAAIRERLQSGNRAYFANLILLKNKLISRKTKLTIYYTLIRPIITYGSESWTLTQEDQEKIRRFERKIIRRIYGAIRVSEEEWRIRTNREIQEILKGEDIVKFIKSQRLRWFGHVQRMEEGRMPKKILHAKVYATRRRGRPRLRWLDQVVDDLKVMRVTGWGSAVKDRAIWRRVVEEAKAHPGL